MNHKWARLCRQIITSDKFVPFFLFLFCFLADGILLPNLGFYGDDWSYLWVLLRAHDVGTFFNHNREIFGTVFSIIAPLIGPEPFHWQIFAFLLHWLSAVALWLLLKSLWPERKSFACLSAVLYMVYPSFMLQSAAATFWVNFLQIGLLFLSLFLSIEVLKKKGSTRVILILLALLGEVFNLILTEYYFFLEFVRPVLLWIKAGESVKDLPQRIKFTFQNWIPYLGCQNLVILARIIFQSKLNGNYPIVLFSDLASDPVKTVYHLLLAYINDFKITFIKTWTSAFLQLKTSQTEPSITIAYLVLIAGAMILVYIYFHQIQKSEESIVRVNRSIPEVLLLGIILFALAGLSFRMAGVNLTRDYSTSRFTLPYIVGNVFILAGICSIRFPAKWLNGLGWCILIGFAVGMQFLVGNQFSDDWNMQRSFLYQMAERMPDISKGTILIADGNPSEMGEENATSAAINFIYDPQPGYGKVDYYYYFIPERVIPIVDGIKNGTYLGTLHLLGQFDEKTGSLLAIHLDSSMCMRVINPDWDTYNTSLSKALKNTVDATTQNAIQLDGGMEHIHFIQTIYGDDPTPGWCRNYQEADLALQRGDWDKTAALGDQLDSLAPFQNDPEKLFTYIDAYIKTGQWDKAEKFTRAVDQNNQMQTSLFCPFMGKMVSEAKVDAAVEGNLAHLLSNHPCNNLTQK
jgi:hypothetical protein